MKTHHERLQPLLKINSADREKYTGGSASRGSSEPGAAAGGGGWGGGSRQARLPPLPSGHISAPLPGAGVEEAPSTYPWAAGM